MTTRKAARSLRRHGERARERLRYRRATPREGTRPGIPCFWIFDNDKSGKKKAEHSIKANRILQRLGGREDADCVDWPDGCFGNFAVWDNKLEKYIAEKAGKAEFEKAAAEFATNYDIDQDMCLKFPTSASGMLLRFRSQGIEFVELDAIVKAVDGLLI